MNKEKARSKKASPTQHRRDVDLSEEEQRAAEAYAEAIRIRREEEFRHGLPLARLLELDIPKKSDQRRIRRILEAEEQARQNLEAIRRKLCKYRSVARVWFSFGAGQGSCTRWTPDERLMPV